MCLGTKQPEHTTEATVTNSVQILKIKKKKRKRKLYLQAPGLMKKLVNMAISQLLH